MSARAKVTLRAILYARANLTANLKKQLLVISYVLIDYACYILKHLKLNKF